MNAQRVVGNAKAAAKKSGLTYRQIGLEMGCPEESARQSVYQFFTGGNPTVGLLIRFAKAVKVDAKELM